MELPSISQTLLSTIVNSVLTGEWHLEEPLLIECNGDILYEQDNEALDEDETELYSRKLKKPLVDLKIKDLSLLNVQGRLAGEDVSIYL